MHEFGQLLGHGHEADGLMAETLAASVRVGPDHDPGPPVVGPGSASPRAGSADRDDPPAFLHAWDPTAFRSSRDERPAAYREGVPVRRHGTWARAVGPVEQFRRPEGPAPRTEGVIRVARDLGFRPVKNVEVVDPD